MTRHHRLLTLLMFLVLYSIFGCHQQNKKEEVEAAMQNYDQLLKKQDADSISLLFTPDGELGNGVKGRDSIRHLLASFANFKVLSQKSASDSIVINQDSAVQQGHYYQTVITPSADTLHLSGTFTAHWIDSRTTGWLLKRMDTKPGS